MIVNQETININKLLDCMVIGVLMSASEIMKKLCIKARNTLQNQYLHPAIKSGLVKLVSPDKPNSSKQMYYKV